MTDHAKLIAEAESVANGLGEDGLEFAVGTIHKLQNALAAAVKERDATFAWGERMDQQRACDLMRAEQAERERDEALAQRDASDAALWHRGPCQDQSCPFRHDISAAISRRRGISLCQPKGS